MTIDLSCGAIGVGAGLEETVVLAKRHGFESFTPSAEELAGLDDARREKLLATMKAEGIVFGAAGLSVEFRGDDGRFEKDLAGLGPVADGLKRAGVTRVGTWITPGSNGLTYMKNFERHSKRLARVAAVLEERGIRLGLEYVGPRTSWGRSRYPFIHTMEEMKDLIRAMGQKNVGFVLDSWHWYTAREKEADLLSLSNQDVVAVDLNDAPAGKDVDEQIDSRRELPCATGVIDLATFLSALNRIGYDGPVRAEPFSADLRKLPRDEALAATAAAMKKAFALIR